MDEIKDFINNRPNVVAAYGYGSKLFKQDTNLSNDSLIDLILVVENIKNWHKQNMEMNPNDYTKISASFFNKAYSEVIKGSTKIAYISDVRENNKSFKYGTVEFMDLLTSLNTWLSFYMPGRFQKTIYPFKENEMLSEAIENNRRGALLVASFLQDDVLVTKKDLFKTLVGLSYMGDTRMLFAENPKKIDNIVNGCYDEYIKIYDLNVPYLDNYNNSVVIDKNVLDSELKYLPYALKILLKEVDFKEDYKKYILDYLKNLNQRESLEMTFKGIASNGISRSLKYAGKKIEKRFK